LQHVLEAAQVGADGLALIGPSHALDLVGRDAEAVRPEPHPPRHQSNIGVQMDQSPGSGTASAAILAAISLSACAPSSAMDDRRSALLLLRTRRAERVTGPAQGHGMPGIEFRA